MKKVLSIIALCSIASLAFGVGATSDSINQFSQWTKIAEKFSVSSLTQQRVLTAFQLSTDIDRLNQVLLAKQSFIVISLPLPDGTIVDFRLTPSAVAATELLEKYPEIRTFSGYQLSNPKNNGRFDITPAGFHGMFRYNGQLVFIDPLQQDSSRYLSYYRKNAQRPNTSMLQLAPKKTAAQIADIPVLKSKALNTQADARIQTQMRTYRLAISATGEYTQAQGGTTSSALAALVTLVNRLNDVYQRDLAIRLELIAANDAIIYTDAETDPFNNDSFDGGLNTDVIDVAIGSANYDIGHVVNTDGGGLAGYGVVCNDVRKGDGITGHPNPVGDAFYIDFVAHEVGHQFRADHTFNGFDGSCEDNREVLAAYEPGSASTIMGYAGICNSQNLQNNSDPYFHTHSITQISDYITSGNGSTCGSTEVLANNDPLANAGTDRTIPAQTPFTLTGSATDEDSSDILSYSWEQYDLGPASLNAAQQVDDGQRPLFRAWSPVAETSRTLPRLADILANQSTIGETYASTTRELNFRLVVRDDNGGVNTDSMKINVIDTSEAFAITEPVSSSLWTTSIQQVNWNVAGTADAPINCVSVNISLSSSGGQTFETSLAQNVTNDGNSEVILPNINASQGRIKVSCADNIFFAISSGDFSLTIDDSIEEVSIIAQQEIILDEDASITLTTAMFTFGGLSADLITLLAGDNYQVSGTTVTPDADFNGQLSVGVIASRGNINSDEFSAVISVSAVNDLPQANDDSYTVSQGSSNNIQDVLLNDSDSDGDSLTIDSITYGGTGEVIIVDNKISYSPASTFSGTDSFSYNIIDSAQDTAQESVNATVTVTVQASQVDDDDSGSSGGAALWLLILLSLFNVQRKKAKLEQ